MTIAPLLEMRRISKSFPGVRALDDVSIDLAPAETLGLIGENGAGKSTLIKMLGGAHLPDAGEIRINGNPVSLESPLRAQELGIGVIYQEFNLIPQLTVRQNIFLGRAKQSFGVVNVPAETRAVRELFGKLGATIAPEARVADLSIAEKQIVEIAKALAVKVRILVMDEPTATLTPVEVERLFRLMRELHAHGMSIIYISHRLDEILEVADRLVVLRDGKLVAERAIADTNRREMIELMVGRTLEDEFPRRTGQPGEPWLHIENLRNARVKDVSFVARRGEILGITGLVGSGRTELARLIFGADRAAGGTIQLGGNVVRIRSPRDAIHHGICLLTEDRAGQGLLLEHSVVENFALPNLAGFSSYGILNRSREVAAFKDYAETLRIKFASPQQLAGQLSGGNQQKLVLAKWLETDCQVIVVDEPTRGIDVGAKYEIYQLLNRLAEQGKVIIMISSEMPEVLGMCDRILVMRNGKVEGEIASPSSTTQAELMELAAH